MGKKYKIIGGYPLKGKIKASGNKNAALPIIAASLLTDEEVIIRNIPNIEDIKIMLEILKQIGSKVKSEGKNTNPFLQDFSSEQGVLYSAGL